ncbi:DUF397 domain-containing protein [Nocardiopsis mangrovi]|uniref:DUF397 domain-containing protein n=1 Tax=Nocardiopsis mangrovi TaxID=1179818 RepID=A0ABV9E2P9_9ACTN
MNAGWHKSTYSGGTNDCVEVAEGARTLVRDTQNRDGAVLSFPVPEWRALLVDLDRL